MRSSGARYGSRGGSSITSPWRWRTNAWRPRPALAPTRTGARGRSFGRPPAALTREARQALLAYQWPGNVRELRNALERAAIVCEDGHIHSEHLSLEHPVKPVRSDTTDLGAMERDTIAKVLRDCRWNKVHAARRLGLSRTQLYVRMRRYSLECSVPA